MSEKLSGVLGLPLFDIKGIATLYLKICLHVMKVSSLIESLLIALLLSALVLAVQCARQWTLASQHFLEFRMRAGALDASGKILGDKVELYYSQGSGFSVENSARQHLRHDGGRLVLYRFPLPEGRLAGLRLDPSNSAGRFLLTAPVIKNGLGDLVVSLPHFTPVHDLSAATVENNLLRVDSVAGTVDPFLEIGSLQLTLSPSQNLVCSWFPSGVILPGKMFLIVLTLYWALRLPRVAQLVGATAYLCRQYPGISLLLAASFSTALSCYPILFFGKSLVSPSVSGVAMLYPQAPFLPGNKSIPTEEADNRDIGALMWQNLPYSVVQSEALLDHWEFPLWNRYNSSGLPLFGQGQSLILDPLHLLPVLSRGSALGWDLKFTISKWLFAVGCGFLVFSATSSLASALLLSIFMPFIGFYGFRLNHPAYFSLTYTPWILLCWTAITKRAIASTPESGCRLSPIALLLPLLFTLQIASGPPKESFMLAVFGNLTGALCYLFTTRRSALKTTVGEILPVALLCLLVSAPVWGVFVSTLLQSGHLYNDPHLVQVPVWELVRFFEPALFNDSYEFYGHASGNWLLLIAVSAAFSNLRGLWPSLLFRATLLGAVVPFCLAFGIIPKSWILATPVLRNITHIGNTFGCVLLLHVVVLAGFGIKVFLARIAAARSFILWCLTDLLPIVIVPLTLVLMLLTGATPLNDILSRAMLPLSTLKLPYLLFLHVREFSFTAPNFWINSLSLLALPMIPLLAYWAIRSGRFRQLNSVALLLLLVAVTGRHGLHLRTPFRELDRLIVNPVTRPNLLQSSASLDAIRADQLQPGRILGLGHVMFPGSSGLFRFENVSGADALVNPLYGELLETLGLPINGWGWLRIVEPDQLLGKDAVLNLLNVTHLLGPRQGVTVPEGYKLISSSDLSLWHRPNAWPRAFFVNQFHGYSGAQELKLLAKELQPGPFALIDRREAETAGVSLAAVAGDVSSNVSPALSYSLTANTTSFVIDAPSAGLVVLTESFVPDEIFVSVNGVERQALRVNHAFRGVLLDKPGRYQITFRYRPRYWATLLLASTVGLGISVGILIRELAIHRGKVNSYLLASFLLLLLRVLVQTPLK